MLPQRGQEPFSSLLIGRWNDAMNGFGRSENNTIRLEGCDVVALY